MSVSMKHVPEDVNTVVHYANIPRHEKSLFTKKIKIASENVEQHMKKKFNSLGTFFSHFLPSLHSVTVNKA